MTFIYEITIFCIIPFTKLHIPTDMIHQSSIHFHVPMTTHIYDARQYLQTGTYKLQNRSQCKFYINMNPIHLYIQVFFQACLLFPLMKGSSQFYYVIQIHNNVLYYTNVNNYRSCVLKKKQIFIKFQNRLHLTINQSTGGDTDHMKFHMSLRTINSRCQFLITFIFT